jgi:hypothetical protein
MLNIPFCQQFTLSETSSQEGYNILRQNTSRQDFEQTERASESFLTPIFDLFTTPYGWYTW